MKSAKSGYSPDCKFINRNWFIRAMLSGKVFSKHLSIRILIRGLEVQIWRQLIFSYRVYWNLRCTVMLQKLTRETLVNWTVLGRRIIANFRSCLEPLYLQRREGKHLIMLFFIKKLSLIIHSTKNSWCKYLLMTEFYSHK